MDGDDEKGMSHFFRSQPLDPYTYLEKPDGAPVGLYRPNHHLVEKGQFIPPYEAGGGAVAARFRDNDFERTLTEPRPKNPVVPSCSQGGTQPCSLRARVLARGNKTALTEAQQKTLKIR